MTLSRPLIFIDTETGGLDPREYALIEVAWATLDDPEPRTIVLPHEVGAVSAEAAKVNGYYQRRLFSPDNWSSDGEIDEFIVAVEGKTLAGANIAFDAAFIKEHMKIDTWHYRMLDIESMFYGARKSRDVPGMKLLCDILRLEGHDIPEPDHTAAGDVRAMIAAYKVIR